MTYNNKGKSYELVAETNKGGYSLKLQREKIWRHFEANHTPEYVVFANYKPHHLKNLKRGCKLFLESHWPGYAKDPRFFKSTKNSAELKNQ